MSKRSDPYDYYVVVQGLDPGIYSQWEGGNGARARVEGFSGAVHKGFYSQLAAIEWFQEMTGGEEPILWCNKEPFQYFTIIEGKEPGIYRTWFGTDGAYSTIMGFRSPLFKGFYTFEDAKNWYLEQTGREPELRFSDGEK